MKVPKMCVYDRFFNVFWLKIQEKRGGGLVRSKYFFKFALRNVKIKNEKIRYGNEKNIPTF